MWCKINSAELMQIELQHEELVHNCHWCKAVQEKMTGDLQA
jgi:hypothetical protein